MLSIVLVGRWFDCFRLRKWPYLLHPFQRISFPSPICEKTDRWLFLANIILRPQGRIFFAELWYSRLKKLPDDEPLYSSQNWIKKKQYLRLHLSNCCAYKPCVLFEIIIRNEQNSDHPLSEIVSLSRVHNHATTRPTRLPVCRL